MNDDFLRRARRPPPAAFERQLRERLRKQELEETSRRRPSWRLLAIAMLVGGSALATATYMTLTRTPSLPSSPSIEAPVETATDVSASAQQNGEVPINRFLNSGGPAATHAPFSSSAQQESPIGAAARDSRPSPADPSSGAGGTETSQYIASTGREPLGRVGTRSIRIVVSPDIAAFAKDTSPGAKYTAGATFEEESADKALPTLCAPEVEARPEIVVTSRRARKDEFTLCGRRYADGVLEATLGHIAIVVTRAKNGAPMQLSTNALRLALMKQVPAPDNSSLFIDNPYTHWHQIDPALEERRITVLGPARNSAEFLVFAATLLAPACENNGSLDPQLCQSVREDGVYTEANLDNNFVQQRLWSDPDVVAIMDYRFYVANSDDLLGSLLTGDAPTRTSIIEGNYAGARTLRAYVNRLQHRNVPKVSWFINEYLRLPGHLHPKSIIPPDGNLDPWRPYDGGPKLTQVKLD